MPATAPVAAALAAPLLRLPYPLLEYLLAVPDDQLKLVLRLLPRAQRESATSTDAAAGRLRFSLSIEDLAAVLRLARATPEAGPGTPFRAVLERIECAEWSVEDLLPGRAAAAAEAAE